MKRKITVKDTNVAKEPYTDPIKEHTSEEISVDLSSEEIRLDATFGEQKLEPRESPHDAPEMDFDQPEQRYPTDMSVSNS